MIELRHADATTMHLSYAGDTYNTAVYLRRTANALAVPVEVGYLTGLGDDEYSDDMRAAWAAEGVTDHALPVKGYLPGFYTVRVDERGERRFAYWRSASAARELFAGTDWIDHLDGDVIHLSGITLQLAAPNARDALVDKLDNLRTRGARISFDTNYRPAGWHSAGEAAEAMDQVSRVASIVFATLDEETAMHRSRTPAQCADRLAGLGVQEAVVKTGADGAHVQVDGQLRHVPARQVEQVVDTTAAGDAFAGGYLAARIAGMHPFDAAGVAADVAGAVVTQPGAIIPVDVPLLR
jgi:2-dehydro-3-deoxygluconokinase